MRREDAASPVVALLAEEIVRDEPGQEAVLDRLLDLLLIASCAPGSRAPAPARPSGTGPRATPSWATRCGCCTTTRPTRGPWPRSRARSGTSRAALARRFTELVGEPPMTFLAGWRIALASDLLLEPGATIGSVAERVGYGSPFALSAAFKRVRGISPREHREAPRAAPAA